ncbi:hypothetical protein D3C72_1207930 [compost metagenome]
MEGHQVGAVLLQDLVTGGGAGQAVGQLLREADVGREEGLGLGAAHADHLDRARHGLAVDGLGGREGVGLLLGAFLVTGDPAALEGVLHLAAHVLHLVEALGELLFLLHAALVLLLLELDELGLLLGDLLDGFFLLVVEALLAEERVLAADLALAGDVDLAVAIDAVGDGDADHALGGLGRADHEDRVHRRGALGGHGVVGVHVLLVVHGVSGRLAVLGRGLLLGGRELADRAGLGGRAAAGGGGLDVRAGGGALSAVAGQLVLRGRRAAGERREGDRAGEHQTEKLLGLHGRVVLLGGGGKLATMGVCDPP